MMVVGHVTSTRTFVHVSRMCTAYEQYYRATCIYHHLGQKPIHDVYYRNDRCSDLLNHNGSLRLQNLLKAKNIHNTLSYPSHARCFTTLEVVFARCAVSCTDTQTNACFPFRARDVSRAQTLHLYPFHIGVPQTYLYCADRTLTPGDYISYLIAVLTSGVDMLSVISPFHESSSNTSMSTTL